MGIEPTRQRSSTRLTDFEDRGRHQPSNAYRSSEIARSDKSASINPLELVPQAVRLGLSAILERHP